MLILPFRRIVPSAGPSIVPGSQSFTTPGTFTFVVPYYNTLTVDVRGGGGGGGGARFSDSTIYYAGSGGFSGFYAPDVQVFGLAGGGANGCVWSPPRNGDSGGAGAGQGGSTNITGGGSSGGIGAILNPGAGQLQGGSGGNGGRAIRTWVRSQWYTNLAPRTAITVIVGAHGVKSECEPTFVTRFNTDGGDGAVYISWS
jgi:hypothetical protein